MNRIDELGGLTAELGVRRPLLVTDPGIEAAGHVERALQSLIEARLDPVVFDGVEENPTTRHIQAGLEIATRYNIDAFIGFGGGSAMDAAKGINFLFTNGGKIEDYWGVSKAKKPMLPVLAVPTTAGTGSEAQSFALIADEHSHRKMACGDKKNMPRVALLDPLLTISQPSRVAAVCGLDALAHAVESWVARTRTPLSCLFASEAWQLLRRALPLILREPSNIEARADVLLGAHLAGHAIESSMLGAAHSAANPLTARCDITHGLAVGIMLPHVVRYNAMQFDPLYASLLQRDPDVGRAGQDIADELTQILGGTGLPTTLKQCGVDPDSIPDMAREAAEQWTAQFNPRSVTVQDFETLYHRAYNGV